MKNVVVIYPNQLLKDQDEPQWTKVEKLLLNYGMKLYRCISYAEADKHINKEALVIIDEFDYCFIDKFAEDPIWLLSKTRKK